MQAKAATDVVQAKLAPIDRQQQDAERLRVFETTSLCAHRKSPDAIKRLSHDRFRAVVAVIITIAVAPVGKGGYVFNPERVQVPWR